MFWTNGKRLEDWQFKWVQPNSLVAIFSTVGKSAIIIPIAEGISQLKWMHLEDPAPRALSQLQYFDDASRGPWGAMMFLWKARVRSPPWLASLGSIITLLLLGFEPFTQQILEFPTRLAPAKNATGSISYVNDLPNDAINTTLDSRMARVLFNVGIRGALFDMPDVVRNNAECPTQDCRLQDFTSLASCFTCESEDFDLSETQHWQDEDNEYNYCDFQAGQANNSIVGGVRSLEDVLRVLDGQDPTARYVSWQVSCSKTKSSYPNLRFDLGGRDTGPWVNGGFNPHSMDATRDYVAGKFGMDKWGMVAEDTFSYCHVAHPEDLWSFVSIETIYAVTCFTLTSNTTTLGLEWMNQGKLLKPITGRINWCHHSFCAKRYEQVTITNGIMKAGKITRFPLHSVRNYTTTIPRSNATNYKLVADGGTNESFIIGKEARDRVFSITSLEELADLYFVDDARWTKANWERLFDATESTFATMVQSRKNPYHRMSSGPAYEQETFVKVRWEWFILPLSSVLLSTVFLLLTALQSARKPYLYKTSLVATLFHGLEGWSKDEMRSQTKWKKQETGWDLLKVAEKSNAKFARNPDGDLKILKVE